MRSAVWLVGLVALVVAGCGGPAGGGTTPRSRSAERAEAKGPPADYDDENSVGMTERRVTRWRWKGARKDCFYVVGNRCFKTERAACKAAGCPRKADCRTDDSAPVQVSCPKARRR